MLEKKLKNKNNIIYILICLVFIVINILFLNNKMPSYINLNFGKREHYIITIIVTLLEILLCSLVFIMNKKNIKMEYIFLTIMIPIGLLFLILIPPGQTPDEHVHYARVYDISGGNFISNKKGSYMPEQLYSNFIDKQSNKNYDLLLENINEENSPKKSFYYFPTSSIYNFICYLPQSIGVFIGKALNLPILLDAYLGRLFNFLCFIFFMFL